MIAAVAPSPKRTIALPDSPSKRLRKQSSGNKRGFHMRNRNSDAAPPKIQRRGSDKFRRIEDKYSAGPNYRGSPGRKSIQSSYSQTSHSVL